MNEKQKQNIGNNSNAVQVSGDIVIGSSYSELKEIFMDLFEMNFPRVQEIARQEADTRVAKGLDSLETALKRNSDNIDTQKFTDPNIQYELQELGKNFARFGEKSNYELLGELFATLLNRNSTDVVSLISGEALQVVPKLTTMHVSILTVMSLVYDLTMDNTTLERLEATLSPIVERIDKVELTRISDLNYLVTMGCLRVRAVILVNNQPLIITKTDEYKSIGAKNFENSGVIKSYKNISLVYEWMKSCLAGRFELTPMGRLIGMSYINDLLNLDVNDFVA